MTRYVPASSVAYTNNTFRNNQNIVSVDLKNTPFNTSLAYSFYNCRNLTTVENINFNNKTSLSLTFAYCMQLTNVPAIPNSIVDMASTFTYCNSLVNTPTIPDSVTNMYHSFYQCTNLSTAPTIPNSVRDATGFIAYCPQFFDENIYPNIPQSVQKLDHMYAGMTNTATDVPQWCMDKWNNCSTNVKTSMTGMFSDWHGLVNAPSIPDGVKYLYGTFSYCFNLVNAPVLPNSVITLQHCFALCYNLNSAPEIPDSVAYLSSTFYGCNKLIQAPNIPASVIDMTGTFHGCTNLTGDIYIKAQNITNIGVPNRELAPLIFNNTSLVKNVYIPFNYSNGVNTITYNTFINAGYDELGTQHGVYLKELILDEDRDGRYVDEAVDGSDDAGLVTDLTITDTYDAETITE